MRRIAVLLMTMSALLTVCCGCAWKGNFEWCEREVISGDDAHNKRSTGSSRRKVCGGDDGHWVNARKGTDVASP